MASHRGVGNRYVEMGLPGPSEFDRRWRGRDVSGGFAKLSALFQPEISGGLPGSRLEHHCPTICSPRQRGLVVRRFVVLFIAVLAFVVVPWPATAAPPDNFPDRIDLPNGFRPEGIESGRGTSVFVGSLADGAIWRGDLRTGSGEVCSRTARSGRVSVGIAYEASRNRLWVAGGGPGFGLGVGDVRVYDASSGDLLATFLPPGDVGFLNDVAITHDAVYVTDSFNAQLVRIPLPADGSLPSADSATLLPVTGDFVQTRRLPTSTELSQRAACSSWRETSTGKLFRVDPDTGSADRSTSAARCCPARMVWSCGGTRSTWSAAAW